MNNFFFPFFFLGFTINNKGNGRQVVCCRPALGRFAMKPLEKIFRCRDRSMPTKIRIVQAMIFPVGLYGNKG